MTRPAAGQDLDKGTFVITRAGSVIGKETFTLKQGSLVTGQLGLVIATTATFPNDRSPITINGQVDYGQDSVAQQLQIDRPGSERLVARLTGRRATIRTISLTRETAREYPVTGVPIPAPDSLFAFYILLPAVTTAATVINPADGHMASARETARTVDSVTLGGVPKVLTKVTLGLGDDQRLLWYDESGKLVSVEVPKAGLRAQRQ